MPQTASGAPPPDFRPLVRDAIQKKLPRVVIPPGVYHLAPEGNGHIVWPLRNVHDMEIVADGVTLVSTVLTRAISLDACRNVTLQGLTLDYDPLPFTQGTVVAMAEDKGWVDVKLHAGYPVQPYSRVDVVDPRTRYRKKGMPFLWGTKASLAGTDVVRITFPKLGNVAVIGDFVSMSTGPDYQAGGIAHGITIMNCVDTTFRGVTVRCAPGMGILEANGEGNAKYLGCRVVPGPPPPGATEARLLTTSWDAMQSATLRKGPLIEGCVIEDAGDDSWSMQSADYLVVDKGEKTLTVLSRDPYTDGLQAGDRIRLSNDSPEAVIAACRAAPLSGINLDGAIADKLKAAPSWSYWAVSKKCTILTLNNELPVAVGDSIFSPDRQGSGFIFRNNRLHSSGRVLIEGGEEGLIEGNILNTIHALVVNPGTPGGAACGVRRLVIRKNIIRETGFFCPAPWSSQAGAISITGDSKGRNSGRSKVFDGITIENNLLSGINGPDIVIDSAQNIVISGNEFVDAQQTPPNNTGRDKSIPNDCIIWMADSEHVKLSHNKIIGLGAFAKHVVILDVSVKDASDNNTQVVDRNAP